jgi:hypothetical protein
LSVTDIYIILFSESFRNLLFSVCTKIDKFVNVFIVKNAVYFGFLNSLGFHLFIDRPMLYYT